MKNVEKIIEETVNKFDYVKVHEVMECLNWKWGGDEIPSIGKLVMESIKVLKAAYQKKTTVSMGGFKATYNRKEPILELEFIIKNFNNGKYKHYNYK